MLFERDPNVIGFLFVLHTSFAHGIGKSSMMSATEHGTPWKLALLFKLTRRRDPACSMLVERDPNVIGFLFVLHASFAHGIGKSSMTTATAQGTLHRLALFNIMT